MKRFRRILFNTLTAISLLLALATAAAWIVSEWRGTDFHVQRYGTKDNGLVRWNTQRAIRLFKGTVTIYLRDYGDPQQIAPTQVLRWWETIPP